MKKRILLILALLLTLCTTAIAHPGRTDDRGGHYDHDTGQYHYHHGYEAHQHTGGVCPYDFDDKTGENSGSPSSGTASAGNSDLAPDPESKPERPNDSESTLSLVWRIVSIILLGPPMLFFAFLFFVVPILVPILKAIGKRKEEKRLHEEQLRTEYLELESQYSNKTQSQIAELCGMPPNVYLDENNLPHEKDKSQILDTYTVFWEKNSPIYHSVPSCADSPVEPINITQARHIFACRSCRAPQLDLQWYYDYKDILRLMRKHGIEPVPDPDSETPR